jgi:hypothetical protein
MQFTFLTMTKSHIENAIEELREAKDGDGIGTTLMLESEINSLREIKDTYDTDSNA